MKQVLDSISASAIVDVPIKRQERFLTIGTERFWQCYGVPTVADTLRKDGAIATRKLVVDAAQRVEPVPFRGGPRGSLKTREKYVEPASHTDVGCVTISLDF